MASSSSEGVRAVPISVWRVVTAPPPPTPAQLFDSASWDQLQPAEPGPDGYLLGDLGIPDFMKDAAFLSSADRFILHDSGTFGSTDGADTSTAVMPQPLELDTGKNNNADTPPPSETAHWDGAAAPGPPPMRRSYIVRGNVNRENQEGARLSETKTTEKRGQKGSQANNSKKIRKGKQPRKPVPDMSPQRQTRYSGFKGQYGNAFKRRTKSTSPRLSQPAVNGGAPPQGAAPEAYRVRMLPYPILPSEQGRATDDPGTDDPASDDPASDDLSSDDSSSDDSSSDDDSVMDDAANDEHCAICVELERRKQVAKQRAASESN